MTGDAHNTTNIPYSESILPESAHYFGVSSVSKYMMAHVYAALGDLYDDVAPNYLHLLPGLDDPFNSEDMSKYIQATNEEIIHLKAKDATGEVQHRVWIERNTEQNGVRLQAANETENFFTLTCDNKTSVFEDGILTFTGDGLISITPHGVEDGTLYIENSEGGYVAYAVHVVPQHTCEAGEWETVAEPTSKYDGFAVKRCKVCGEILDIKSLPVANFCEEHHFSDWDTEVTATNTEAGLEHRTCSVCGKSEYRFIAPISTPVVTPAALIGDLNRNGEITITDYTILAQIIDGADFTLDQVTYGNVDRNKVNGIPVIDGRDQSLMAKYMVEMIHEFPEQATNRKNGKNIRFSFQAVRSDGSGFQEITRISPNEGFLIAVNYDVPSAGTLTMDYSLLVTFDAENAQIKDNPSFVSGTTRPYLYNFGKDGKNGKFYAAACNGISMLQNPGTLFYISFQANEFGMDEQVLKKFVSSFDLSTEGIARYNSDRTAAVWCQTLLSDDNEEIYDFIVTSKVSSVPTVTPTSMPTPTNTPTPTPSPQFVIENTPTVSNGEPVTSVNPESITAITVPIRYYGVEEQVIEIAAAFYDAHGCFAGFGMETAMVSSGVTTVEIPVRQYADRLKELKIMILDTGLCPLIRASSYDLQ